MSLFAANTVHIADLIDIMAIILFAVDPATYPFAHLDTNKTGDVPDKPEFVEQQ